MSDLSEIVRPVPSVDYPALLALGRQLLVALRYDPDSPDLVETPRRWADAWEEFIAYDPGRVATTFVQSPAAETDQVVIVGPVRLWSMCEHHLLPFFCDVTMGYLPQGRILGLSKFARLAQFHAHRLQVQERLVQGIADDLVALTGSLSVAVLGRGEHLCMTMRGIRAPALMTSSVMYGVFRTKPEARAEFLQCALGPTPR